MINKTPGKWQRAKGRGIAHAQERRLAAEVRALKRRIEHLEAKQSSFTVPQSLAELKPRRLPPPGKTAMQMIMGQWPGEETTEELLAQLKALG